MEAARPTDETLRKYRETSRHRGRERQPGRRRCVLYRRFLMCERLRGVPRRHADRPSKIAAGTRRQYAELDILTGFENAIRHLVDRAVASTGDNETPTAFNTTASEICSVASRFRERDIVWAEVCADVAGDTGPCSRARTGGGVRVNNDKGKHGVNICSAAMTIRPTPQHSPASGRQSALDERECLVTFSSR